MGKFRDYSEAARDAFLAPLVEIALRADGPGVTTDDVSREGGGGQGHGCAKAAADKVVAAADAKAAADAEAAADAQVKRDVDMAEDKRLFFEDRMKTLTAEADAGEADAKEAADKKYNEFIEAMENETEPLILRV